MVEHQSGTLNKLSDSSAVGNIDDLSLLNNDIPASNHTIKMPNKDPVTAEDFAAHANIPMTEFKDQDTTLKDEIIEANIDTEDWMSKLRSDEIFNSDKGPAPLLRGLRRLAKPYIFTEDSKVNAMVIVPRQFVRTLQTTNGNGDVMSTTEAIGIHHFPMASVTFNITLRDGRTFSDSADAFFSNCEQLGLFPTAVASARAEARCLRKVLGIVEHAAEEIVDKDAGAELAPDDDTQSSPVQSKLIDKILGQVEMSLAELLEGITTREICTVEELSVGEARKALRVLNEIKKKKARKKSKK